MSINDQLLNEMLDEEYRKIPSLFKMSKLTAKIAIAAIGIFFALSMMFIVFFYNSGSYEQLPTAGAGYSIGVNIYNDAFIKYAIICLAVVIVVAFWLFMVQYYEKRAFAKASNFASKMHYAELQRKEEKREQERFGLKTQSTVSDDPAFWTFKK